MKPYHRHCEFHSDEFLDIQYVIAGSVEYVKYNRTPVYIYRNPYRVWRYSTSPVKGKKFGEIIYFVSISGTVFDNRTGFPIMP